MAIITLKGRLVFFKANKYESFFQVDKPQGWGWWRKIFLIVKNTIAKIPLCCLIHIFPFLGEYFPTNNVKYGQLWQVFPILEAEHPINLHLFSLFSLSIPSRLFNLWVPPMSKYEFFLTKHPSLHCRHLD